MNSPTNPQAKRHIGQILIDQGILTEDQLRIALLEQMKVPTLLLTGDADLYAPLAVLRLFAARIKNSESLVIPEAGHSAYWEQPEIFNRTVLGFIGKH